MGDPVAVQGGTAWVMRIHSTPVQGVEYVSVRYRYNRPMALGDSQLTALQPEMVTALIR